MKKVVRMKVYVEAYGCAANFNDAEIAKGLLQREGFEIVNDAKNSDVIILFTCIVKTPTEHRMIDRIRKLSELNKPLIVAGCMPVAEKDVVEKLNQNASLIGPGSVTRIVEVVKRTLKGKRVVELEFTKTPKVCLPKVRKNPVINIVQISEGCLWKLCTYCIVKFSKGEFFSYPPELIVEDVKKSLEEDCKEIWLTSQDTGSYGLDIGYDLPSLLNRITQVEGKFFVRVGMMNPIYVKPKLNKLIQVFKSPKIFKFIHLPVQSGSDRVLKSMKRGYTVKDFLTIVEGFRKNFPYLSLSTDIIVGFPGESDEDFQKTVELIEKVRPDIVNVSKFGARPGTEAEKFERLPHSIIAKRSKTLRKIIEEIQIQNNEKWVGWEGEVLIDEVGKKGTMVGRNFAYKPVVIDCDCKLGEFVKVKVVEAKKTYLVGEFV
ncbi:MAG: tRNA (N(6)-L-threonylcarbamoyladenosine(37)-C(2))-methylthiotransferase [Candidatus Aenigmarchaeota archaeon]|nr:tRNA (N(6)-L-threonylcarbamoyladenosine(37)-C(2))-methylthiotransferase [Candidatus Aenigmarchaeota archaeon]